jgi:glycosyltransferase involved in cell wall biosynthesis
MAAERRGRPLLFLWEHIGPTHADRLEAVAAAFPDRPVMAIQYRSASHTYGWDAPVARNFTVHTLCPDQRAGRGRLAWRLLRTCLAHARGDLFLCHYQEAPVWLTAMGLRLIGRPAFTMMESKFDDYPRRLSREALKRFLLRPYRGALTASLRSRDYLRFLGLPAQRLALGYSTLSVARIEALAGAPPAPDGVPHAERDFVAVARAVPKKNLALAIQAFARWRHATGGMRALHLCGDGPEEAGLRALAGRLGVADRVHFHGFVQTAAVAQRLAGALCLLLPSTEEQFGLAVIEAQAMGVPVLLSTVAGAADRLILPGVNGFLLPPHGPEAWAATMALVSEDEDLWRHLASGARDRREAGDCRHFAAGVRQLLESGRARRTKAMAAG